MKEIFPTNPIQEVIVEIKFPLNLRITREICVFQEKIKSEYPKVTLEESTSSELSTDIRYVFQDDKQTHTIFVERERLVFVSNDYHSFESFSAELMFILDYITKTFYIEKVSGLRLNFINVINGTEGTYSALEKYVNFPLGINLVNLSNEATRFAVQIVKQKENITLVNSSAFIPDESSESDYRYILDIDSMMDDVINYNNVLDHLSILNDYIYEEFLSNITDEFKQTMRMNND